MYNIKCVPDNYAIQAKHFFSHFFMTKVSKYDMAGRFFIFILLHGSPLNNSNAGSYS